jgi:hypothetical protein
VLRLKNQPLKKRDSFANFEQKPEQL